MRVSMDMKFMKNIVVIIPVYHPDIKFNALLRMLKKQEDILFDVYIVNSGSDKGQYATDLEGLSYTMVDIDQNTFNHGGTRRRAAETCKKYAYLVYMTQDAVLVDKHSLSNILKAFADKDVGCAYGRQLPNADAGIWAAHARLFNYPDKSQVKQLSDKQRLGIKTVFISDTFAAYRRSALFAIGNFPEHVILSEDTYVAAKMVLAGWKIAYCADAKVYHSHNYTIMQEFRRYFDTGVFHAEEPWIRKSFGVAEGEGKRFVLSEIKYIMAHKPWLVFSMIFRDSMKFLGYRLGIKEKKLSNSLKKKISMNPRYWE